MTRAMSFSHTTTQAIITGAIGLAAVIVVRWLLGFGYGRYEKRLSRTDPTSAARRRTTFSFVRRVVVAVVAAIAVWSVLSLYDATEQLAKALLASSAVLALFVGLAFSTPLSNLGSGLLVAFTQPLRLGDRITVGGETGFVEEIALIYTTLVTDDARRVFVPNTQLTTGMIVNRTIKDPRRAVTARFPVALSVPVDAARSTLLEAIADMPGTAASARVVVGEIGESTVWLEAAAYGPLDADVVTLASDLRERGLAALREQGFLRGT
jgi:small-conductance mechanosensitive channel